MKKILALTLALLMLLTAFASCNDDEIPEAGSQSDTVASSEPTSEGDTTPEPWKPPVTPPDEDDGTLKAPETAPNDKEMTLVRVMDGTWTKPKDEEAAAWTSESTDKTVSIFDNGGTVNLNEYSGFMVRVKPAEENNGIYLRFFFKMADNTEIEILAKERNLNWYNGESWTAIKGAASNWKLPIGEEGYAYIEFPLEELEALSSQTVIDIKIGSYATGRSAIFSEWTLVKGATSLTTPTKLADGSKIELVSISDGTYTKDFAAKDQSYATELEGATTNIFANGATVDLSQYKGLLVKKTPDNENGKGIYVRFKFKDAAGTEVEVKAQNRELGWFNGTWGVAATATSNWKLTLDEEGYIFLDFSKFEEFNNKTISDICIYNSESDRSAKFSEWSLVKVVEGGTTTPDTPVDPPVVIPAPTIAVPTTLPDGSAINQTKITDGMLVLTGGSYTNAMTGEFAGTTTTVFANGATVKLGDYDGILFRVITSAEKNHAGLRFRFKFTMSDDSIIEVKAGGMDYAWWDGEKWETIDEAGTSNWTTPSAPEGYLYLALPFAAVDGTKEIKDIQFVSQSGENRLGIFCDWSFVKATPVLPAPTTLQDGTSFTLTEITDGTLVLTGASYTNAMTGEFTGTTTTVFANGATVNMDEYNGILFKFATAEEKNHAGIRFRFKFTMADDTVVEVKAGGMDYAWWDGEKWETIDETGSSNWTTPSVPEGYLYLALPFDAISNHTTHVVKDIQFLSQSGENRLGSFSEWSLVKVAATN
ncbi:MAG: hypothetical protein IKC59_08675 [Clostridia bacterium]|nr:hypothetical protein [Clostridia bacterium]